MRKFTFCFWLWLALPVAGAELKFDFGDSLTNQPLSAFRSVLAGGGQAGEWKIVMDEVPPLLAPLTPQATHASVVTRRAVLAQVSQDTTTERFPMFLYTGETFRDFTFTTRFKIVSGAVEQMAGVVFRAQDEKNFYVLRASALGRNLRFYKVVNGIRSDPLGPSLDITVGVWHTLTVQCQGNEIRCWFDGRLAMPPLNDNSFPAGKIGFWTKSDAVSYFSDASITYTPRVPLAQTIVQGMIKKYPRLIGLHIYTLDEKEQPHIIASQDEKEIGQAGTEAEKGAITNGVVYFGKTRETVVVTMPLRDRNGDPMAAVRFEMKSFPGQTQDNALARARPMVREIQAQVLSSQDLNQ
jgi:hypothetical protein